MSDDLSVKLYFGNGHIRYGEHGADLSEFNSVDHVIKRAASRTWGVHYPVFLRTFHVDAEQHDLSIMALINRIEPLHWELMPFQGTEYWRSYIKTTCDIRLPMMLFIQIVHKGLVVKCMRRLVLLTRVRLNYKQEMLLQLSHKKKEMVVSVRKKKEMVTHTL
jgi:hypothetical protein